MSKGWRTGVFALLLGTSAGIINLASQAPEASPRIPPGTILAYAGDTAPAGYSLANGELLNGDLRENADICRVIRGLYTITGDPRGVCRLPDLRARLPIGAGKGTGSEDGVERSIGQKLGASSHRLTLDEMPPHSHVTAGALRVGNNETYLAGGQFKGGDSRYVHNEGGMRSGPDIPVIYDRTGYMTTRVPNREQAAPFETLSPSLVVTYIIKH